MPRSSKQLGGARKRSGSRKSKGKKHSKRQSGGSKKRSVSKSKSVSKMASDMCHCVTCKKGVKPANAQKKNLPNGRCALTGTCPTCGTKVFKFCKC